MENTARTTDTRAQVEAYLGIVRAIADTIRDLGQIPSGHLYARVMDKMSIETYQGVIDHLKRAGLIKEPSYRLLVWDGPTPVRTLVPYGPDVVYAPPAFKGQKSAKGATKARVEMIEKRLAKGQTS